MFPSVHVSGPASGPDMFSDSSHVVSGGIGTCVVLWFLGTKMVTPSVWSLGTRMFSPVGIGTYRWE